jgi:ribonuclease HI
MSDFTVFTDGSCHTQQKIGAWVSIILCGDTRNQISGICQNTTHNRMELLAVIESVDYISLHFENIGHIEVLTDSQYVVGIQQRKDKLKKNLFKVQNGNAVQNDDLVQKLVSQLEDFNIKLIKVKAHQKKTYKENLNREADMLVRKKLRLAIKNGINT